MLSNVVGTLLMDQPLPVQYRDHALTGEFRDCRECHLKPDLLLMYRFHDTVELELIRLGSHSDLFD